MSYSEDRLIGHVGLLMLEAINASRSMGPKSEESMG